MRTLLWRAKHVLQLFSAFDRAVFRSLIQQTQRWLPAWIIIDHPSRCLDPPTMMLFMLSVAGQRHLDRIQT